MTQTARKLESEVKNIKLNQKPMIEIAMFRVKKDRLQEGLAIAKRIPEEARAFGQILSSQTLQSALDPTKICHVVRWKSEQDFENAFMNFTNCESAPAFFDVMDHEVMIEHFVQVDDPEASILDVKAISTLAG